MKKWTVFLLTAILAAGLLAGCQPQGFQPTYPEGVTKEKLEEISTAYEADGSLPLSWYHIDGYGWYYLGNENGYDIIYCFEFPAFQAETESNILEKYTYKIGNTSFYPRIGCLWAYKNGVFNHLRKCYDEGLISENAVLLAKERFDAYMQILKNMDPDVYWQREKKYKLSTLSTNLEWESPAFIEYLNGSQSLEYPFLQLCFQAAAREE